MANIITYNPFSMFLPLVECEFDGKPAIKCRTCFGIKDAETGHRYFGGTVWKKSKKQYIKGKLALQRCPKCNDGE